MSTEKLTLEEALQAIAEASFYENKRITPLGAGRYAVEETHTEGWEEWYWNYADGLDGPRVSEHSRLHETYEHYSEAQHIRYNLPETVAKLEAGTHLAEFAYTIVYELDCDGSCGLETECDCDQVAGWIIIAQTYEIDEDGELK